MLMSLARLVGLLVLAATLLACALHVSNSGAAPVPPRAEGSLRVATWNVHYIRLGVGGGRWSVGDWERRKAPMDDAFKATLADVMAFQEMESFARGSDGSVNLARDFLLAANPGYAAAANGDWREFPSTQPIFYRKDRLRLLDQGWFFFSETPDVIYSRTFDGSWPAFASWAQFETREGRRFHVFNVHFEYRSRSNRRLSAELVRDRIAPLIAAGEHVLLVGDVNDRAGSRPVTILEEAGLTFAPVAGSTFHFNRGINLFGAIDHLAASAGIALAQGPGRAAPAVPRRVAIRPLPGLRRLPPAGIGHDGKSDHATEMPRCSPRRLGARLAATVNASGRSAMAQINVNGQAHEVEVEPDTPAALGPAGAARPHRHQVRLRHRRLRRLHRPYRRRGGPLVHVPRQRPARRTTRSPPSRGCRPTARTRCSRPGSSSTCRNAATASPARSWPPPRS